MDQPEESTEKLPEPEAPEGATLERYKHPRGGHGYLVIDGRETTESGFHATAPGVCPSCDTKADGWEPPVGNQRFEELITRMKQEDVSLDTDAKAHKQHLIRTGGYIHECSKCGTTFFISSTAAKVKV